MYFIFWYDYVLLPLYVLLSVGFLNAYFRMKYGSNPVLKKHFNRGLTLKLIGCIAIGLIYEHYYNGAYDGRFYFEGGKMLRDYWLKYPSEFFPVLFSDLKDFNYRNFDGLNTENVYVYADESFFVAKIAAIFNLLSFNAFLPCSVFFCTLAFLGIWNLFVFFIREYKLSPKLAGLCSIYIPSVLIWDSGIFKDTVSFTALCWMFICGYYAFIKPTRPIVQIVGFLISAFFIAKVKVYILAAFVPFFILYIFNSYKSRIKNPTIKTLATPFVIALSAGLIFLFLQNANELLGRYSIEKVLETANTTYTNITLYGGSAGSAYDLDVDFSSPAGILKAIPVGINLTLFRPYPWEYLKPFILFASAESMIILYFTLMVFFKGGVQTTFKLIGKSPILLFCLLFSLLFAFMTGVSSANFGTLVRYKIPILPFYALFLMLLYQAKFVAQYKQPSVYRGKRVHFAG